LPGRRASSGGTNGEDTLPDLCKEVVEAEGLNCPAEVERIIDKAGGDGDATPPELAAKDEVVDLRRGAEVGGGRVSFKNVTEAVAADTSMRAVSSMSG